MADTAETAAGIREGYERAEAAAEKAIALDPDRAEGYAARGFLRDSIRWDWRGAREDAERALALNPGGGDAQRYYAVELAAIGRWREAVPAARKATEIDPLSADAWATLAWVYLDTGELERAAFAFDRALDIAPEHSSAWANRIVLLLREKCPAEALAVADRTSEWLGLLLQSAAYHDLGDAQRSQRALEQLIARYGHSGAVQIAEAYAWRGDRAIGPFSGSTAPMRSTTAGWAGSRCCSSSVVCTAIHAGARSCGGSGCPRGTRFRSTRPVKRVGAANPEPV